MTDWSAIRRQFDALRAQLQAGQIDPVRFQAELDRLQARDSQGRVWRLDPSTGGWMVFDAGRWVPGTPPPEPPRTLAQLLWLMLKSFPKAMVAGMGIRLLIGIPLALGVWLVHSYLVVVVNEGTGVDRNAWTLNQFMALPGWQLVSGTAFWAMAMFLLTTLVYKLKQPGLGPFLAGLFGAPGRIVRALGVAGIRSVGLMAGGAALGLAFGGVFGSGLAALEMALGAVFSIAAGEQSLLLLATALGWSDAQRWFRGGRPARPFVPDHGLLFVGGLGAGLLAAAPAVWLPFHPISTCVGVGLFLAVALVLLLTARSPAVGGTAALILCVLAAAPLYADDGGWREGGGTFQDWVSSDGAVPSVAVGIPPAIGALVGLIFGSSVGTMPFPIRLPPSLQHLIPDPRPLVQPRLPDLGHLVTTPSEGATPTDPAAWWSGNPGTFWGNAVSAIDKTLDRVTPGVRQQVQNVVNTLKNNLNGAKNTFVRGTVDFVNASRHHRNTLRTNTVVGQGGQVSFRNPAAVDASRRGFLDAHRNQLNVKNQLDQTARQFGNATGAQRTLRTLKNVGKGVLRVADKVFKIGNAVSVYHQARAQGSGRVGAFIMGTTATILGHFATKNPAAVAYEVGVAVAGQGDNYGIQTNVNNLVLGAGHRISGAASHVGGAVANAGRSVLSGLRSWWSG